MATLDQIRTAGETKIARLLADSDAGARGLLADALRKYGRVQDIPDDVWQQIRDHYADNDRLAAAILLLFVASDDWTTDRLAGMGVQVTDGTPMAGYAIKAARQTQSLASTVDTLKDRIGRRIEDSRLTGPGETGELTDEGIDAALDDVFTASRRETIATNQTTGAITGGQVGARNRHVGDDGAAETIDGTKMTVALIWKTERDNLVCPRCSPLEGQPEEVWSLVFPEGPGEDAHPNCRCELMPTPVLAGADSEGD